MSKNIGPAWPKQRVAAFIDVQNLFYGARNNYKKMISYERLMKFIARGRTMVRAVTYIVEKQGSNQEQFKKLLFQLGYEIRTKQLIERGDGSSKGNWDVAMAVDALQIAPRVDVVVLATGDGDFTYLVEALKYMGVRVEVISIRQSTSIDLINVADGYIPINEDVLMDIR